VSQETTNRSFDELARELASGTLSRGRMLRLMGAALVGGALASLGIREAVADNLCKPTGKKCRKNSQCCSGNCSSSGTCLPAGTGPNLVRCTCADGVQLDMCTSSCGNLVELTLLCVNQCAARQSTPVGNPECSPNNALCSG
jgi:hypothetical protein